MRLLSLLQEKRWTLNFLLSKGKAHSMMTPFRQKRILLVALEMQSVFSSRLHFAMRIWEFSEMIAYTSNFETFQIHRVKGMLSV